MQPTIETSDEFFKLDENYKLLVKEFIAHLGCDSDEILLERETEILAHSSMSENLLLLTEGSLEVKFQNRLLYYISEGELLGLDRGTPLSGITVSGQYAVKAKLIPLELIRRRCFEAKELFDLFTELLTTHSSRYLSLLSVALQSEPDFSPNIQVFEDGEEILKQGDSGDDVFTLMEGSAVALVNGVKVGEIAENEIFGFFAAVTETPRTATVISTGSSTAVVVKKEKFVELIRSKPNMALKLLQDMAKQIVQLNAKVVKSTNL